MTKIRRVMDDDWFRLDKHPERVATPVSVILGRDWNELCELVEILEGQVEAGGIPSNPPSGKCKVLNIYWDPDLQKMVVEYEDVPVP